MTNTLKINPNQLRALFAVAPTKTIRKYMNGAHIETGAFGAYGVATNGACMLIIRLHSEPMPTGRLYAPSSWKLPSGDTPWTLTMVTDEKTSISVCTLEYAGGTLRYEGNIERYADWRRVVPDSVDLTAGVLSSQVVDRLNKAAKLLGCIHGAVFATNGPSSAALVEFPGVEAFGVAMPFRHDLKTTPPDWYTTQ